MIRTALAALVAPLALLPVGLTGAEAHGATGAVPTCHGVRATIVGHDGDNLLGTHHRDVVVTQGARAFRGEGGDDLVCVTGSRRSVRVATENGDDQVYVLSRQSEVSFISRLGSDEFHGNSQADSVFVRLDGDDTISTGGGHDFVELRHGPRQGHTSVDTGSSDDDLYVEAGVVHGRLSGGSGTNWLHLDHRSQGAWVLDNVDGTARDDGQLRLRWREFTHFDLQFLEVPTLTFDGSDADEYVDNDQVSDVTTAGIYSMGGGDDQVHAGRGNDVIDGGDGTDAAYGGEGTDTCHAEAVAQCELP